MERLFEGQGIESGRVIQSFRDTVIHIYNDGHRAKVSRHPFIRALAKSIKGTLLLFDKNENFILNSNKYSTWDGGSQHDLRDLHSTMSYARYRYANTDEATAAICKTYEDYTVQRFILHEKGGCKMYCKCSPVFGKDGFDGVVVTCFDKLL